RTDVGDGLPGSEADAVDDLAPEVVRLPPLAFEALDPDLDVQVGVAIRRVDVVDVRLLGENGCDVQCSEHRRRPTEPLHSASPFCMPGLVPAASASSSARPSRPTPRAKAASASAVAAS